MIPPDLRVIDAHVHQWAYLADPRTMETFLGDHPEIERLVLASDLQGGYYPSAEEVSASNRSTLRFMELFPDRISGWCYVNPRLPSAIEEFDRGMACGLMGLKLWVATRCSEPVTFPIIERAIEANVPMLVHTWRKNGGAGNLAEESLPTDMADLARRYPEGRFLMAHFGGDWEFGLRAIRNCPNVWADFSGTINEYGAYEQAIRELGEDRVVFGSDLPADFRGNLGRVLQGGWPRATLDKVLAGNFETMIAPR
jgi:uncharacterized protein